MLANKKQEYVEKKSREAETQTEFQLERSTKGNMKRFYKYAVNKRKTKKRKISLQSVKENNNRWHRGKKKKLKYSVSFSLFNFYQNIKL